MSSPEPPPQVGVSPWLVRLDDVSKAYGEDGEAVQSVLADVSFHIERNGITAILGQTGCGKSTLLHLIAGLISQDGGSIDYNPQINLKEIGIVLQDSILLPWRTVEDNIILGRELRGEEANLIPLDGLLEVAGLRDALRLFPYQLSGGMRRKTVIVRTLLTDPVLLLLDEPFNGIDALAKQRIADHLVRWVKEGSRAIVLVTHDLVDAVKIASRVLVLGGRPARIVEDVRDALVLSGRPSDCGETSSTDRLLRALARTETWSEPS
jgi:NitT/TauT family transport system ATP-binding protein